MTTAASTNTASTTTASTITTNISLPYTTISSTGKSITEENKPSE